MQVAFYLAGEIPQVLDAIPWVRCASGNVFYQILAALFGYKFTFTGIWYQIQWSDLFAVFPSITPPFTRLLLKCPTQWNLKSVWTNLQDQYGTLLVYNVNPKFQGFDQLAQAAPSSGHIDFATKQGMLGQHCWGPLLVLTTHQASKLGPQVPALSANLRDLLGSDWTQSYCYNQDCYLGMRIDASIVPFVLQNENVPRHLWRSLHSPN